MQQLKPVPMLRHGIEDKSKLKHSILFLLFSVNIVPQFEQCPGTTGELRANMYVRLTRKLIIKDYTQIFYFICLFYICLFYSNIEVPG